MRSEKRTLTERGDYDLAGVSSDDGAVVLDGRDRVKWRLELNEVRVDACADTRQAISQRAMSW